MFLVLLQGGYFFLLKSRLTSHGWHETCFVWLQTGKLHVLVTSSVTGGRGGGFGHGRSFSPLSARSSSWAEWETQWQRMEDARQSYCTVHTHSRSVHVRQLVASLPLSQACNLATRPIPMPWESGIGRRETEPLLHLHRNEDTTGIWMWTWTLDAGRWTSLLTWIPSPARCFPTAA